MHCSALGILHNHQLMHSMNSSFEIALKVPDLHGGANASNLKLMPRDKNVKVTKLVSTDAGVVFSGCFPCKKKQKMHLNEFFSISCPQPQISALSEWISGHVGTAPVENACNIACAQSANVVCLPSPTSNVIATKVSHRLRSVSQSQVNTF